MKQLSVSYLRQRVNAIIKRKKAIYPKKTQPVNMYVYNNIIICYIYLYV